MKHPPYMLRVNKSADRMAFIDAVRRLERLGEHGLSDYSYHGLGGPYLEEFKLLYEFCPEIEMFSIEKDEQTLLRQEFHLPSKKVQLVPGDLNSYIAHFDPRDRRCVFWLDFTDLTYDNLGQFEAVLGMVPRLSMVKITLQCEPKRWRKRSSKGRADGVREFQDKFAAVLPNPSSRVPPAMKDFAVLIQDMVRVVAEGALRGNPNRLKYMPVSSFCYSDGTGMYTLTGIICEEDDRDEVLLSFGDWSLANFDWGPPVPIELPFLSTKERLTLAGALPTNDEAGRHLNELLGYFIDQNEEKSAEALQQYATFHRHAPYLMKAVP